MSQIGTGTTATTDEDLAVQDTLSMSTEQRLDLLVSLIVDKIIEEERSEQHSLEETAS